MAAGKSGGGSFEIAKAFISVEARLKQESVDAVKSQVATALKNQPGPGGTPPPSGGVTPPKTPPSSPQGGGSALAVPEAATPSMGRESVFKEMGRRYGTALRESFGTAIGNLGAIVTQRTEQARKAAETPRSGQVAPRRASSASRGESVVPGMTPESIAARFTQRFAAALQRAPIPRSGGGENPIGRGGRSGGGGPSVTNNVYNTQVRIDPRKIHELLEAIRVVNQLRSRNRAGPNGAPGFESRESGASTTQQFSTISGAEGAAIAKLSKNATMLYRLRAGAEKLASVGLGFLDAAGGRGLIQSLAILSEKRKRVWREERHTRFHLTKAKDRSAPTGVRRKGQFYFNNKFRGAMYRDFATRNAASIESALGRRLNAARQMKQGGPMSYSVGSLAALDIQDRFRKSKRAREGLVPATYRVSDQDDGGSSLDLRMGRRGKNSMLNTFTKNFFAPRGRSGGFRGGRGGK